MVKNFSDHDIPAIDDDGIEDVVTKLVIDEINDLDFNELNFFMNRICGPFTCAIIHMLIKKGYINLC